jgi:hypothetical protein
MLTEDTGAQGTLLLNPSVSSPGVKHSDSSTVLASVDDPTSSRVSRLATVGVIVGQWTLIRSLRVVTFLVLRISTVNISCGLSGTKQLSKRSCVKSPPSANRTRLY